ncbi:hypothetical protein ASPWEDRAFT_178657 [Aspergillus wentii DTO 134E9]|uniref:DUF4246 domain-containing protein n=1 Tax=Aspergillus wentii DTO 134E9 TaxID=1073089 RepID=A0A1L9S0Z5_ASPWE|nr:uncharacterized protein ASPWEDRAFT_178657 [Aspergillus wentii DTO 134E9]OJJ40832.1 hypothetical protein ASPWEDRAFT_178657 [Aspergillus wentii DTO 134E9]
MMGYMIKEAQWTVEEHRKTGIVNVFDVGVVESDTIISEEEKEALKSAVWPLEDIPEELMRVDRGMSRDSHRKILALFLVDPNMRVISSANMPPQREDW